MRPDGSAPTVDPWLGRVLDGRYRIQRPLAAGGVGQVYEAEHVKLHKAVALKVLHGEFAQTEGFLQRFEREARAASRLSHPGCVSVIDFGRVERADPVADTLLGTPYLVMELVRGEPLEDRLARGPLPPTEAVHVARGILAALRHAHGLGIAHRDVKPGNVMLAPGDGGRPLVKLLDFGLAKELDDQGPPLTAAGFVFGTPRYLSPEQAGGKPADARSDLYAVGVVLFEMLTGRPLFRRDDPLDVVRDHLHTPPPQPRDLVPTLSPTLEAAVLWALEKDPARRCQTADALVERLDACPEGGQAALGDVEAAAPVEAAAGPPSAATATPAPTRFATGVRALARPWPLAGLAALAFSLSAFGSWLLRAHGTPPPPPPAVASEPLAPGALRRVATALEFQRKLWCSDALDELERALREEPRLRDDPAVARAAIPCLRAKTQARAVRFIVEGLGPAARAALGEAAAADPRPDVRAGAQQALAGLDGR